MTPGASAETADGMSEGKIEQIAELMRCERYRFAPARRVFIPKKNGKPRPLGLPSWPDKLVGEVVRLLLEAYYEPGIFRPLARVPERARVSHRTTGDAQYLDRDRMVYRG
jgi:retron-type reverse transcriptase